MTQPVTRFGNAAPVTLDALREALHERLTHDGARVLTEALGEAAADPAGALPRHLAQAARRFGRAQLDAPPGARPSTGPPSTAAGPAPEGLGWTVDDAVRTLLLAAAAGPRPDPQRLAALYHGGDAAERRGVLRALGVLHPGAPGPAMYDDGPVGAGHGGQPGDLLGLVHDALRTNDTRLVAAALGPYGARHLDQHTYRQAVLKCLHCAIPLHAVAGLRHRADRELARMALTYAEELASAGRPVPPDLWLLADSGAPPLPPTAAAAPTTAPARPSAHLSGI